jgi:hypothetical protein
MMCFAVCDPQEKQITAGRMRSTKVDVIGLDAGVSVNCHPAPGPSRAIVMSSESNLEHTIISLQLSCNFEEAIYKMVYTLTYVSHYLGASLSPRFR